MKTPKHWLSTIFTCTKCGAKYNYSGRNSVHGKTNGYLQHASGTQCDTTFDRISIAVVEDFVGVAFKRMLISDKALTKALPHLIGKRKEIQKEASEVEESIKVLQDQLAGLQERSAELQEKLQVLESDDVLSRARALALKNFDGALNESAQKTILSVLREAAATDSPDWPTMKATGNRVLSIRFWGQTNPYNYNLAKHHMKMKKEFISSSLDAVESEIDQLAGKKP